MFDTLCQFLCNFVQGKKIARMEEKACYREKFVNQTLDVAAQCCELVVICDWQVCSNETDTVNQSDYLSDSLIEAGQRFGYQNVSSLLYVPVI